MTTDNAATVSYVRDQILEFVEEQGAANVTAEDVDIVLLEYVAGIAEDFSEEDFCPEELSEMLSAYLPSLGDISQEAVLAWMNHMASDLKQGHCVSPRSCDRSEPAVSEGLPPTGAPGGGVSVGARSRGSSLSESVGLCDLVPSAQEKRPPAAARQNSKQKKKGRKTRSSNSTSSNHSLESEEDYSSQVELLSEMFPDSCSLQIRLCITDAHGGLDEATELLLEGAHADAENHMTESGPSDRLRADGGEQQQPAVPAMDKDLDGAIRKRIVNQYMYTPEEAEGAVHKPFLAKSQPKKMTRYRDGQVVSTKGERFSDTKKPTTDEMKKTYINLKPMRQYRFH